MKSLDTFVVEKLKITKRNKAKKNTGKGTVKVKDRKELREIMHSRLDEDPVNLDLSDLDVSELDDTCFQYLMAGWSTVETINISGWDLTGITNLRNMFADCSKLTHINFDGVIAPDVIEVSNMFYSCESIEEIDVTWLEGNELIAVDAMFSWCKELKTIDGIEDLNVSKCKTLEWMFNQCKSIEELDLSNWDVSKVRIINNMFRFCEKLKDLNLNGWDLSNLHYASTAFRSCENLNIDLSKLNIPSSCYMDDINKKAPNVKL